MSKYIETALPLTEINEVAIREKAGKPGHPANLHMWWGAQPGGILSGRFGCCYNGFFIEI